MEKISNFGILLRRILRPNSRETFLVKLPEKARVLDVGFGNNSAFLTKRIRPDLYYVGLDIGEYNQSPDYDKDANEVVFVNPEEFHNAILNFQEGFDGIISSHNLEHCNYPDKVLQSICEKTKKNGYVFLAFPSEGSVNFPSRKGTLNFYDDKTHNKVVNFQETLNTLKANNFQVIYSASQYKPPILWLLGLILEPISIIKKRLMPLRSTWAFYGFESIIIAKKL